MTADGVYVLECDLRPTPLGPALRVQFERYDDSPMGWEELHAAFARRYPGRFAVQVFPPISRLLNGCNKYTLWVLDRDPAELDISRDPPRVRRRRRPGDPTPPLPEVCDEEAG